MLIFEGCYTRLKHPEPALIPDDSSSYINAEYWDFSCGWYGSSIEIYPVSYSYYYVRWWDDCAWCNDEYYYSNDTSDNTITKINRRDDPFIPFGPFSYGFTEIVEYEPAAYVPPTDESINQIRSIEPSDPPKKETKTKKSIKIPHKGRRR
jgi:hypothetical protein